MGCGQLQAASKIAAAHVQRLLGRIPAGTTERYRAIVRTAPVIFHTSKVVTASLLAELPSKWLDRCVNEIANFILKKCPSWDPYEATHDEVFELTIDEMYTLCDLAEKATVDVTAYWIISTISASLNSKAARKAFTGNQRADLITKMNVLVGKKFPTPGFIAHDGYLVLSMVSIGQLDRYSKGAWEETYTKALAIPNVADRCLVLADIAGAIAKYDNEWAVRILRECQKFAEEIPSALDRASRLELMAREAYKINRELSKELFSRALRMTVNDSEPEYDRARRDIVDSAHQISPDLAASIASALDDDQARRAKRGVSSRMELLELRRKLVDPRGDEEQLPEGAARRLSEASWALLGSLNSERVLPLKLSRTKPYIEHAASLPFRSAFAIYSYVVENAIQRRQERTERERILRGLYRSLSVSADLFYFLAERSVSRIAPLQGEKETGGDEFFFADAGGRQKSIAYIEKWLTEKAGHVITIHDQFLTPVDAVEILKMILAFKPNSEVNIITSRAGLQRAQISPPFADQFRAAWADSSSQAAPLTRIVVVSVGSEGGSLTHDRWWCSEESGLDLGTSFNGLGHDKGSKIRIMSKEENAQAAARLSEILGMGIRYVKEKRVVYESADL